jgi:hypothetical protein
MFEILAEIGLKSVREAMLPSSQARPLRGLVGYIMGGVSLEFVHHKFAVPIWLQIANIVASLWCGRAMASASKSAGNTSS